MKIHEYQAKADPEVVRRRRARRRRRVRARRGRDARSRRSAARSPSSRRRSTRAAAARAAASSSSSSAAEAEEAARGDLGKPLVTQQTGPEGQPVRTLLVERGCSHRRGALRRRRCSTARATRPCSWRRPRAAWRSRRSPRRRRRRSSRRRSTRRSGCRPSRRAGSPTSSACLRTLLGEGAAVLAWRSRARTSTKDCIARRDQPARRHRRTAGLSRSTPR